MKNTQQNILISALLLSAIILGAMVVFLADPEPAQAMSPDRQGNYIMTNGQVSNNRDNIYVIDINKKKMAVYVPNVNMQKMTLEFMVDFTVIFKTPGNR